MSSLSSKFLFSFLTVYLGAGSMMQIPSLEKFLELDPVNQFVFYTVFGVTLIMGIWKYSIDYKHKMDKNRIEIKEKELDLYEKRKQIDDHYPNKKGGKPGA